MEKQQITFKDLNKHLKFAVMGGYYILFILIAFITAIILSWLMSIFNII